jgi:hypothetical protein
VQNNAYSMHTCTEKEPTAGSHGLLNGIGLTVAGDGAQFAGQEVVRGPRAADRDFAVLELFGSGAIPVLILFHTLGVNQVGDVDEHALGSNLLAADFFFQRIEQLVNLDGEGAGFGLALAFAGSLDAELGEVIPADGIGQLDVDHGFTEGAIADDQLDVHLRLASKLGDAEAKGAPVDPDSLAEGIVAFKDGAKLKGKDGGSAEASADNASMFNRGLVIQVAGCVVVFADNYGEFTTGIAENRGCIYALNTFEQERAASAGSIREGLVLGETIRVPRHV